MPNGEPENFFVLIEEDGAVSVRRLGLHLNAQEALAEIFNEAYVEFLAGDLREIPYDGVYTADSGEILVAAPFDLPDDVVPALREPMLFDPLDLWGDDVPRVKAVFTGDIRDGNPTVLFQAFQSSQYLHNKRFTLSLRQEVFHPLENPGFNVRGDLHAVYVDERLLFRNDWWVKRMLDLSAHYREATDAELEEFIALDSVGIDDREQFFENADTWVRKRVATINDRQILEDYSPAAIQKRARMLGVDIEVRDEDGDEQVVLSDTKRKLKQTLRFLNEDMYAGPITKERFVSTNKRRFEDN